MSNKTYVIMYNPGKWWHIWINDEGKQEFTEKQLQLELEKVAPLGKTKVIHVRKRTV